MQVSVERLFSAWETSGHGWRKTSWRSSSSWVL